MASAPPCGSATSALGSDLPDEVTDVYYGLAWANDSRTLFYVRTDPAVRPHQVWRHVVGTPTDDDVLVLQEDDERFYLSVHRARSGRAVVVTAGSKLTTEVYLVDADDADDRASIGRAA